MIDAEFPRQIKGEVKFADRYTLRDFARIGVAVLGGWMIASGQGLLAGLVLGFLLAEFKPGGKHLDEHLVDHLEFTVSGKQVPATKFKKLFNGVTVLEDDTVVGIVKVTALDPSSLSEREQQANRETIYDLLKNNYRIEIRSRQRTVDLSRFQGATGTTVTTDHYVLLKEESTPDSTLKQRIQRVNDRCIEVRNTLTAADVYADRLVGSDLETAVARLDTGSVAVSRRHYTIENGEKPIHRLIYITDYPRQVKMGWLADVLNVEAPGLVDVIQVSKPISETRRNWIDRMINRLDVEAGVTRSPVRRAKLRQQQRDAEDMAEAEASGEVLVDYGVYIVARGTTREETDETLDAVTTQLHRLNIEYQEPAMRTRRAVQTESAFHSPGLGKTVTVPGRSAASGYPFAATALIETNGIVAGHDAVTGEPVVIDRFSWEAGHIGVMGKIGSGKSYWTNLMLLRSAQAYDELDIYVIDPKKRDYGPTIDAIGGDTVLLDSTDLEDFAPGRVTRYTVEDPSEDNTECLATAVRHVYKEAAKSDAKTLIVIDEVHRIITRGDQTYDAGMQALSTLVRESRDRNIAVTLVTQNASEFTRSEEGKNILRNINCYLFFKQQEAQTALEDFFHLTEEEATRLRKLRTGTQLPFSEAITRGPVNTSLRIESTDAEHQIIADGQLTDGGIQQPSSSTDQQGAPPKYVSTPKETDAEPTTPLTAIWSGILGRSAKLFEFWLLLTWPFTGILVAHEVITVQQITRFDPTGLLPSGGGLLEFFWIWAVVILVVETLWVLLLGLHHWVTGGDST